MELKIDGIDVFAKPGQTLRQLVQDIGLDHTLLSQRPLAAKLAGEVFNLNYVPVRRQHAEGEPASIRRAMAASGGMVQLLRYSDPTGKEVYTRTAQFVIFLALRSLWPELRAKMNCTLGPALYIQVENSQALSIDALKQEIASIVAADIPLLRKRISTREAMDRFTQQNQPDKAQLLTNRKEPYFDIYCYEDFADYYFGELAPSTGYLQVWDVLAAEEGFLFLFPDDADPDRVGTYSAMPNFFSVFNEGERWCSLMECQNVADLNALVSTGKIRELIRVNEALHERSYSRVADMICSRGSRAVLLAGPSSSGKTTSANRLATQLRVHGKKPVLMSLDDYYIDRDKIAPGPDGRIDLEHINTIDTQLFSQHLALLLTGETVELPTFDFLTGRRMWRGNTMHLEDSTVIIVEGLHALNPRLLPKEIPSELVFRMYVSPMIPLNLDDHNRIPTSYLRLLRRIVRDHETRGASVAHTLSMWDSVRRGEKRWIFPYQENADVIFNSSTLYELAVLKKHIYPLLTAVQPEESCYEAVRGIVKILNFVLEADVDDEIPPTSLVREFIGGNSFYRKSE